jgi:hypothetical protein
MDPVLRAFSFSRTPSRARVVRPCGHTVRLHRVARPCGCTVSYTVDYAMRPPLPTSPTAWPTKPLPCPRPCPSAARPPTPLRSRSTPNEASHPVSNLIDETTFDNRQPQRSRGPRPHNPTAKTRYPPPDPPIPRRHPPNRPGRRYRHLQNRRQDPRISSNEPRNLTTVRPWLDAPPAHETGGRQPQRFGRLVLKIPLVRPLS